MKEFIRQPVYLPIDKGGGAAKEIPAASAYINPLERLRKEDRERVGGKAAHLGELTKAGFPVPPGVGISVAAHREYLHTGELPKNMVAQIVTLRETYGGKIAIRSSATVEDGDKDSMAGVFTSRYIREEDDIEEAVKGIYAQANSTEVKAVLVDESQDSKPVEMGLVVQKLIEPMLSGVIYTGTNGDKLHIGYTHGLGEALVDGQTEGAQLLVDAKTGNIDQSLGYDTMPFPKEPLKDLASIATRIKEHYEGTDQDIEFALTERGEVAIVQARTHTTSEQNHQIEIEMTEQRVLDETKQKLKNILTTEKEINHTENAVLSDSNYRELLPHATEMGFGVFGYVFSGIDGIDGAIQIGRREMGYQIPENSSEQYIHYVGGVPYFTILADAKTFYMGIPDTLEEYVQTLGTTYTQAVLENPEKAQYPEFGLYLQDPTHEQLEALYGEKADEYFERYKTMKEGLDTQAETFQQEFFSKELPQIEHFIQQLDATDISTLTPEETTAHAFKILEHLRTVSCVDFVKAARLGFYYTNRTEHFLSQIPHCNIEETYALLMKGLPGNKITDAQLAVACASDEEALQVGREQIGHFSHGEALEIHNKRLRDDERLLEVSVQGLRDENTNFVKQFKDETDERERKEGQIAYYFPDDQRDEVMQSIKSAQTYMTLRETVKYHFTREYAYLRDALVHLEGQLGLQEGDIFYLYPRELPTVVEEPEQIRHLIRERRQAYEHYKNIEMPSVIGEETIDTITTVSEKEPFVQDKGNFLSGKDTVQGTVVNLDQFGEDIEGMITYIQELQGKGEEIIMVGEQMNLTHDPYIALSKGVILRRASIASHGAHRAQEQGKPALGGINTRRLTNGMRVELDPKEKTVIKLPEREEEET